MQEDLGLFLDVEAFSSALEEDAMDRERVGFLMV